MSAKEPCLKPAALGSNKLEDWSAPSSGYSYVECPVLALYVDPGLLPPYPLLCSWNAGSYIG